MHKPLPSIISDQMPISPTACEHSVPFFWPWAASLALGESAIKLMQSNTRFLTEAVRMDHPPMPQWATSNTVRLELKTMLLRDFSKPGRHSDVPVLVDAPYAGHSSTIADYAPGQSLVQTLLANGLQRVFVTDWKPATEKMRWFDIDTYLAELNAVVDDLGGVVHLVGLCQGGWLSTMFAARFPGKVKSLVLAGTPIDTNAGHGQIKELAHNTPMCVYEEMVAVGHGLMLGDFMLAGWKNMHPVEQYAGKYLNLYQHITDKNYLDHTETFESWYEHSLNLPGAFYLQAIDQLFKRNLLAHDKFVALGRTLKLKDITIPVHLLAGEADDITTHEQVFAAEKLFGTAASDMTKQLVPGGHIGLFMGCQTLQTAWPDIAKWIAAYK